ncbi:hypothetical protein AABB24_027569 [Solanum stoloniferum]|uniref:Uncharacterized protein n=1 Tax=Solanum stoloniferum TaxID=62892 RepID=A0ABD2S2S7_9SOLN
MDLHFPHSNLFLQYIHCTTTIAKTHPSLCLVVYKKTPSNNHFFKKKLLDFRGDESSYKMKMSTTNNNSRMGSSKKKLISSRGLGGVLREQRAKLYIIRRCVVMLLCWND